MRIHQAHSLQIARAPPRLVIYILQRSLLKLEDRTAFHRDSPRIYFTRRAQEVARDEDIASRDIRRACASLS